ncbi:hypothetical protein [Flavobacterium sp. LAR06]|uniref:hypothetical protein n=1 Tax=Flavobacterium sp. LAR06 TaxID=3064897 RepID=UPI0035C16F90
MKKSIITLAFLFLYNTNCHAEGQDIGLNELANIMNLVHSIVILISIVCYIIISRFILKVILTKKTIIVFGKKINNSTFLVISVITFLLALFLAMIFYFYFEG